MNYFGGGRPYRRETPNIPSVSEPIPEARPLRERAVDQVIPETVAPTVDTAASAMTGRPKLKMLMDALAERGPLLAKEVTALIGTEGTNIVRMINGSAVRQRVERLGNTQIRILFLDGQEEMVERRIQELSGRGEPMPLRIALWEDGCIKLVRGAVTMDLNRDEVARLMKLAEAL